MYVERVSETRFLTSNYEKADSRLVVLYGQKGVGKTTLIKNFVRDKNYAYYEARACSDREQRFQWACELNAIGANLDRYPEYSDIFNVLYPENDGSAKILVIDEFHHLVKGSDSFIEALLSFVKACPAGKKLFVILISSASGWVENSMISKLGYAALSINGLLKVREMKFDEICRVHELYPRREAIKIYAALGGSPGLWNSFDDRLSAKENMIHNLLNRESRLFEMLSVFMSEELREPAVYNTILAAMARGCNKLNDIYRHTGFSRAKISVYLKNLMELDLVEKVSSYETEGYENTQKGLYRIANPYIRFYFRFIFPNRSLLEQVSAETFYEQVVVDAYPAFVEECYCKVCRESLQQTASFAGEWIGKDGNLDIVAEDTKGILTIAFCSYAKQVVYEDYEWLLFCASKAKIRPGKVILFSENGCDERLAEMERQGAFELHQIL